MILKMNCGNALISQQVTNESSIYSDFSDGSIYKNHPVILKHPSALQIVGYYDELEVCNPLGSNIKKHKLGLVFFTLTNLSPHYCSNYKGIFLLTVANVSLIEEHGIDKVLEPLVNDLKVLATTGINVKEGVVLHASLIAFLADNLASHCIGGFNESMTFAKRFCRSCLTDKESSYICFTEQQFNIRTPNSHQQHCLEIDDNPALSTTYGINRNSILNTTWFFCGRWSTSRRNA